MSKRKVISHDERWQTNYELLVQLWSRDTTILLVLKREIEEENTLASWVKNQRRNFRGGKLNEKRTQLLTDIGFAWEHKSRFYVNKLPDFEQEENKKLRKKIKNLQSMLNEKVNEINELKRKICAMENNALMDHAKCLIDMRGMKKNVETTNVAETNKKPVHNSIVTDSMKTTNFDEVINNKDIVCNKNDIVLTGKINEFSYSVEKDCGKNQNIRA